MNYSIRSTLFAPIGKNPAPRLYAIFRFLFLLNTVPGCVTIETVGYKSSTEKGEIYFPRLTIIFPSFDFRLARP